MQIREIEKRELLLIQNLTALWERSAIATHLFLNAEKIAQIKQYLPQALSEVAHLIIAPNEHGEQLGFMGINEQKLKVLFLEPALRGQGLGRKLLQYGIDKYGVNEQNPQAVGFYKHLGFKIYKRTDLDEQGAPYPFFYMRVAINQ